MSPFPILHTINGLCSVLCSPCFNMLPWNSRPVASTPPNQPYGHPHFPACSRLLPQAWLFIARFAFLIGPVFLFHLHVISQVIIRRKSHTDKRRTYGKVEKRKKEEERREHQRKKEHSLRIFILSLPKWGIFFPVPYKVSRFIIRPGKREEMFWLAET